MRLALPWGSLDILSDIIGGLPAICFTFLKKVVEHRRSHLTTQPLFEKMSLGEKVKGSDYDNAADWGWCP